MPWTNHENISKQKIPITKKHLYLKPTEKITGGEA